MDLLFESNGVLPIVSLNRLLPMWAKPGKKGLALFSKWVIAYCYVGDLTWYVGRFATDCPIGGIHRLVVLCTH